MHLAAGVGYWRAGWWLVNPEHPPVVKLLAAAPIFAQPDLSFPSQLNPAIEPNQWDLGRTLLYDHDPFGRGRWTLFLGRLPMIAIWGALAWLLWRLADRRWGTWAGLLGVSLLLFDPTFLGHGHLITTDVAAAVALLAVVWRLERLVEQPNWRNALWLSGLFAIAQLTKYSLLWLWLIIPLLLILAHKLAQDFTGQWLRRTLGLIVAVTVIATWVAYGFELRAPASDPRIERLWTEQRELAARVNGQPSTIVERLAVAAQPDQPLGRWFERASHWPIPAYSYWRGAFAVLSHNYSGHGAFLFGQTSGQGWWWYFPAALALKTPLLTLSLFAVSVWFAGRQVRKVQLTNWRGWIWFVPPLSYFIWSLGSHINIGVRHILPVYPFMFLGIAWLVRSSAPWWIWRKWLIPGLMLTSLAVALAAYPNTIGYFNATAGGTSGGHRYLLDSNLDWNQDIWRLRRWLDRHNVTDYSLALFGSIPAEKIFPEAKPIPPESLIAAGYRPKGPIIISAGQLFNRDGPFAWLRDRPVQARVGSSIWIFNLD